MSNRNGRRGGRQNRIDTSNMPLEQGVVCSLRDSFGFIHCAQRPIEIFFHYSQVSNCHPDELKIDDEVEFKVGGSKNDPSKLAAYELFRVPEGTVVWETEDYREQIFRGTVEKTARNDQRNNSGDGEGTIRLVAEDADENNDTKSSDGNGSKAPPGQLIRYRAHEFQSTRKGSSRLFRGDLVEFRVFTEHRTNQKYAKEIKLLQTEKERQRAEKEKELMETAVEEEGIVVSLNNGFGFIKSNKRRDHVYFHYSNMLMSDDTDDFELQKGQELKFLVVTELDNDGSEKRSARSVECLPAGSVIFHTKVAEGVKGIVDVCPHPPIGNDDKYGIIRLEDPLSDGEETIKNVLLEFSDAPGGTYTYKHQSSNAMGLWIENGDTLLFDVVKEVADGSYRASPTQHTVGIGGSVQPPEETIVGSPAVRLFAASLVHRADGVVHTVKESSGYGFIHFSERPIDVHFKTFNFFPEELQSDLRKQLGYDGKPIRLEAGTAVQFDICAHGTVAQHPKGRRVQRHERENIKGHRILLLPPSAVEMEKVVKKGLTAKINSVNTKEAYSGTIQLEEDLEAMTLEERHPLVGKMIHSFLEESGKPNGRSSLVFRDILSIKEDGVVTEMVKSIGNGLLKCSHIPAPGPSAHPGRLSIQRVVAEASEGDTEPGEGTAGEKTKKKPSKGSNNRQVHYDKSSLIEDLKTNVPPGVGDLVSFDVGQSRRTGRFLVHNLKIVERNPSPEDVQETVAGSGIGIVKEVVPKRKFGFISLLDETATKKEELFFHLPKDKGSNNVICRRGDEVKFDISVEKSGKRVATNVEVLPKGTIPSKAAANACHGFIVIQPSHTSLSDTPLRKKLSHMSTGTDKSGGRWDDLHNKSVDTHGNGVILLLEDKTDMFARHGRRQARSASSDDDDAKSLDSFDSTDDGLSIEGMEDGGAKLDADVDTSPRTLIHLPYKNGAIAIHGTGSSSCMDGSTNPRRGDMVSFVKAKKGSGVRDVRIVTRSAAKFIQGRLEKIEPATNPSNRNSGTAKFVTANEKEEVYDVDLSEVVSCDVAALKDKQPVEAILHEGKLYGICRTADLYLESKLGTRNKERPKLNLTVKKNRGGTIMAQSMMAKGPDGTNGFGEGWTTRKSQFKEDQITEEEV
ncbi:unnamed protein product [Cylindrotheca closterium]|uniref:CSD domain-containing protein n=1 Tax=Cylindrotheca closterium TaxID=2856 RepID=A0AAD2JIB1_9STRA|nr:unnamed protein product [Cylindrotheca closterium]